MKRLFTFLTMTTLCLTALWAQDDDMYFASDKKAKAAAAGDRIIRSSVVDEDAPFRYRVPATAAADTVADSAYADTDTYYCGSQRSVDEYNRRDRFSRSYASHLRDSLAQDSVLISRQDYENSLRMKRFDGYSNITLVINDPWYYDPWYYDPWYWHTRVWYDPWYDPWYGPGWGFAWGVSWGHFSWGIGWRHGWYGPRGWYGPHRWGGGIARYGMPRGGVGSGRWATTRRVNGGILGSGRSGRSATADRSAAGVRTYGGNTQQRTYGSATQQRSSAFGNRSMPSSSSSSTRSFGGGSIGGGARSGGFGGGGGMRSGGFSGGGGRGGRR